MPAAAAAHEDVQLGASSPGRKMNADSHVSGFCVVRKGFEKLQTAQHRESGFGCISWNSDTLQRQLLNGAIAEFARSNCGSECIASNRALMHTPTHDINHRIPSILFSPRVVSLSLICMHPFAEGAAYCSYRCGLKIVNCSTR